jgi:PHP family Zn ribbon phosphoesterase
LRRPRPLHTLRRDFHHLPPRRPHPQGPPPPLRPSFEAADKITESLAKIGNLASDGRPILGLDSRDLLEITLQADPGCYLVPAHVWTPWFAVLGSKSGFDAVRDCYADLAEHIFAVETGLSSDPPMNWSCSSLDAYRLVSNSDAHSPPMLGREATVFDTRLDYFAMAAALKTGDGLAGTIEFFPEEGKYHLDGHRKCDTRFDPERTRELAKTCPVCAKPLTVGVLHRVAELADRPPGFRPAGAAGFTSLVQLPEIMSEILATGPKSKKVVGEVGRLVAALGPELTILRDVPLDDSAARAAPCSARPSPACAAARSSETPATTANTAPSAYLKPMNGTNPPSSPCPTPTSSAKCASRPSPPVMPCSSSERPSKP